jgi:hypothetical protein
VNVPVFVLRNLTDLHLTEGHANKMSLVRIMSGVTVTAVAASSPPLAFSVSRERYIAEGSSGGQWLPVCLLKCA